MSISITHFEIPADDIKRAKKFYEKAFGWKISDPWKMNYFFVETKQKGEEGINGGLMQRVNPGQPFMNYLSVDSIDVAARKVEKAGGVIVMPKREIGSGMGWIAAFKDTEGNILGFHELPKLPAAPAPPPPPAAPKPAAKKVVKKAAKKVAAKKKK